MSLKALAQVSTIHTSVHQMCHETWPMRGNALNEGPRVILMFRACARGEGFEANLLFSLVQRFFSYYYSSIITLYMLFNAYYSPKYTSIMCQGLLLVYSPASPPLPLSSSLSPLPLSLSLSPGFETFLDLFLILFTNDFHFIWMSLRLPKSC